MWGVEDVMAYTGLSRKAAIRMLNLESCPKLPRSKKQKFRVPREAFIKWFVGGQYEEV